MTIWTFLQKNMLLVGVALVSGGMLLWPILQRRSGLSTFEATQLINRRDALLLDVSNAADDAKGRPHGARHIAQDQLEGRSKELEKWRNKPIVVCSTNDRDAQKAADFLRQQGFAEVQLLRGGTSAWRQAGLPMEKTG